MKTIAILNDVHDADYVVQHRSRFNETTLISTHASVDDFLEAHGLSCMLISTYLKQSEVNQFNQEANQIGALLQSLDAQFGNELNSTLSFDVPLRFFYTLYRDRGRYECANLLKYEAAFGRMLTDVKPKRVILFQPRRKQNSLSFFFTSVNSMELILAYTDMTVEKITSPISNRVALQEKKFNRRTAWRKFISGGTQSVWQRIRGYAVRDISEKGPIALKLKNPRGFLVLVNGVRSAELLPESLKNLFSKGIRLQDIVERQKMPIPVNLARAAKEARESLDTQKEIDPSKIMKAIFLEDFCQKFDEYVLPVKTLHALAKDEKILGGVWVRPPAAINPLSLLVEYLLQNNYSVIGRQHGGNYGVEASGSRHFDSDYWWCSHYLSNGFTTDDLQESAPSFIPRCKILPVGERPTSLKNSATHKKVDILFPISNATSFFKDGERPLLHEMAEYQRELLKFLDGLANASVIVKPFPSYGYSNSAFMELLQSLKHIEIVDAISFTQALQDYSIGAIIHEYPSSPLFECLKVDAEILSLTNPLLPFNQTAQSLLDKRVYFYDSLPQIKQGITDFLEGRLPCRRDPGFAERYLLPANPENVKKITAQIFGI